MIGKIVLIDQSMLFVPTVKVVQRLRMQKAETGSDNFIMPPRAMYFNSLLSCLKKIGINKNHDIIILAGEGRSWRKEIYAPYKAQRKGLREKDSFIDWDYEFQQLNKLHDELKNATDWYFIRHKDLEADDIISISCRYFKNKEVIIVTGDKDIFMLAHYPNVKIFSTTKKCQGTKGCYVEVHKPLSILHEKAVKGDVSDNIIPELNEDDEDYRLRYKIVNLLELPKEIEQKGIDVIDEALSDEQELDLDKLPNFKDVKEKIFEDLFKG